MANGNGAPQKAYFPYLNRAVLTVNGQPYYEWESVQVRAAMFENTRTFRFTASEKEVPPSRSAMRIKPGDKCTVELDGYLAVNGEVVTRQVSFSGTEHVVEIQGQGLSGRMSGASVVSQTGEMNNIGLESLAKQLGQNFGVGVQGTSQSNEKFKRVSVNPGQSPWEMLDHHARQTGDVLSESPEGKIQINAQGGGASVIEGWNILEGREVIHSLVAVGGSGTPGGTAPGSGEGSDFTSIGQRPGTDDSWGADANRVNAEKPAMTTDFNQGFNPKVTAQETPAWSQGLAGSRSLMNAMHSDTLQIWVNITLLTWQRSGKAPPSGGLWELNDEVTVNSPMLILEGQPLKLKAVTWSQDSTSGTRSHIELVNDRAMPAAPVPGGVSPDTTKPPLGTPLPQQPPQTTPGIALPPGGRTWSRPR
jgi:prophage tail gpP-like protein